MMSIGILGFLTDCLVLVIGNYVVRWNEGK
jgi:hypothetical protein